MLPLGVIARTQEDFGGIPVIAELTQHQLIVATALANAITFKAKLNKSGKSYYVYLPRRYNSILKKLHEDKREVKVIIIPEP